MNTITVDGSAKYEAGDVVRFGDKKYVVLGVSGTTLEVQRYRPWLVPVAFVVGIIFGYLTYTFLAI